MNINMSPRVQLMYSYYSVWFLILSHLYCQIQHTKIEYHDRCVLGLISFKWLPTPKHTSRHMSDCPGMGRYERNINPSMQGKWHSIFNIWYHLPVFTAPFCWKKPLNQCQHNEATTFSKKSMLAHMHSKVGSGIRQKSWQINYLHICRSVVQANICLSMCPSAHFKQLIEHKKRKTGQERRGITLTFTEHDGSCSDDIIGDPGFTAWTSQSMSLFHVSGEEKGRQSLNSQWAGTIPRVCMPHHGAYKLFYSILQY